MSSSSKNWQGLSAGVPCVPSFSNPASSPTQNVTWRPRLLRRGGQSLVEFALIAPLLFALMFILVELGIIFSIYIGLTNSAREAARAGLAYQYAAGAPTTCTGGPSGNLTPSSTFVDCQRARVMDEAIMATRNPIINVSSAAQLDPSIPPSPPCPAASPAPYRYCYPEPASNAYRYGDKLVVTLSYEHRLFFGDVLNLKKNSLLGPGEITIRASSEMRIEPGGR